MSKRILCISVSMKPGPGKETPSASRNLLKNTMNTVGAIYPYIDYFDLRENPIPLFDGRLPVELESDSVNDCMELIKECSAIYIGVPAYWDAVSSSFKNLIEVLCGPAYDNRVLDTPFKGKLVNYFVIGADEQSAISADGQTRQIFESVGASVYGESAIIHNSENMHSEIKGFSQQLIANLAALIKQTNIQVNHATSVNQ
jgi:NAD(P)H-dependent FMN reductase